MRLSYRRLPRGAPRGEAACSAAAALLGVVLHQEEEAARADEHGRDEDDRHNHGSPRAGFLLALVFAWHRIDAADFFCVVPRGRGGGVTRQGTEVWVVD